MAGYVNDPYRESRDTNMIVNEILIGNKKPDNLGDWLFEGKRASMCIWVLSLDHQYGQNAKGLLTGLLLAAAWELTSQLHWGQQKYLLVWLELGGFLCGENTVNI